MIAHPYRHWRDGLWNPISLDDRKDRFCYSYVSPRGVLLTTVPLPEALYVVEHSMEAQLILPLWLMKYSPFSGYVLYCRYHLLLPV